jgi:hypothetical protein
LPPSAVVLAVHRALLSLAENGFAPSAVVPIPRRARF